MTLREFLPEINDNQWKSVARLISENIIGEDETIEPDYYEFTPEEFTRNELRAEQRAKLTKELESEG